MHVKLKTLTLTNFKGIKDLVIHFNESTSISGDNATGKTTVFDAWNWLLFGEDSTDKKDFNVKTLDKAGNPIHRLDHEVMGILEVDGQDATLKRCLKEKWQKKRGSEQHEFVGHETLFYYNDVPCQATEYASKINIIIQEGIFKLLTNPLYFNSLKWQDRRNVLLNIAGNISDYNYATSKPEFNILLSILVNKTLEEYKREVAAKKKKIKDDLEDIPVRMEEINRNIPQESNYEEINAEIIETEKHYDELGLKINDSSRVSAKELLDIQKKQKELHAFKTELQNITHKHETDCAEKKRQKSTRIFDLNTSIQNLKTETEALTHKTKVNTQRIEDKTAEVNSLRASWNTENEKALCFSNHEFICPACKRDFETSDIETKKAELTHNFNEAKLKKLKEINETGKGITEEIAKLKNQISLDNDRLESTKKELENLESALETENNNPLTFPSVETLPCYETLKKQIDALEAISSGERKKPDNSELICERATTYKKLDELKARLSIKTIINNSRLRLEELSKEEQKLSAELSSLERTEFSISEFTKSKIEYVENRINSMFGYVKFKMFDQQINGGETECCDCLIQGVPWQDVNNAAKINAGIDIINILSDHYGVAAPIFVDNSESINELLPVKSQLIRLIVTNDSHLKIA